MDFKKFLPHLAALTVFIVTVIFMFLPQFQGKAIQQGDVVNYRGASKEYSDYSASTGERMNWTNSMFGGMPTYQISTVHAGNQLIQINRVVHFLKGPAGVFFTGMLGFYLLMVLMGINPWWSIAGAVGATIATNNVVLFGAGHTSKLGVIMYLPLISAGILLAFRRRYLLGGIIFALGMGLAVLANHPQMLYYFALTLPIFGVAKLVSSFKRGELPHFGKAVGALVVGLLLALGAGASNLLTTTEYMPESIRGGQVLTEAASNQNPAAATDRSGGLDWEYAMGWSNGFKDMLATYAPLAAGGGSSQTVSSQSDFGKAMRSLGFRVTKEVPAPLYHGDKPFTEGPIYLGAVVWALFIFGLFTASLPLRLWLGGGTLLIFLVSMGRNMELLNRIFFDTLPMFNKFRTPDSALSIVTFMMVALGIFGINRWLKEREVDKDTAGKKLLYAGGAAAAFGLLVVVLGFSLDYTYGNDAANITRYYGGADNVAKLLPALLDTRAEVYFDDAMRSLLYVGLTFAALYLLWRGTVSALIAALLIGGLLIADFTGVNGRYLTSDDWKAKRAVENPFQPSPADQQILQDPDPYYRVLNLARPLDQDAYTSYFHKSLGGYSAVKLRRYQDLIGGYLSQRDPDVINMLNTKYVLAPGQDGQPQAQSNPGAYGNAWLVNRVESVTGPDAEFAALGTVADLKNTAIVAEEFDDEVAGKTYSGEGSISLTDYRPDQLTYSFNSASDQLAVFSEIWYGPDLGWKATIDGQPAPIIRANYALRAIPVPAGQHTVVMSFEPASFSTGRTISFISSMLIILGLVALIVYPLVKNREGGAAGA